MIVYFYSGYQICNANTIKIQEKYTNHNITRHNYTNSINNINNNINSLNNNITLLDNKLQQKFSIMNKKLDYVTEYKKLMSDFVSNKIEKYKIITDGNELKNELIMLNLNFLYDDEIDKIESNQTLSDNDKENIRNALMTKYLIDNEIITVEIDDVVYEKLPDMDTSEIEIGIHTNDLFETDEMDSHINEDLGSNPNPLLVIEKKNEFKDRLSTTYDYNNIITTKKNKDGEDVIDEKSKQKYLNDIGKKKFEVLQKEYKKKIENINNLKSKFKDEFDKGFYLNLGSDSKFVSRNDYNNELNT